MLSLGICPFFASYSICWHTLIHSILLESFLFLLRLFYDVIYGLTCNVAYVLGKTMHSSTAVWWVLYVLAPVSVVKPDSLSGSPETNQKLDSAHHFVCILREEPGKKCFLPVAPWCVAQVGHAKCCDYSYPFVWGSFLAVCCSFTLHSWVLGGVLMYYSH